MGSDDTRLFINVPETVELNKNLAGTGQRIRRGAGTIRESESLNRSIERQGGVQSAAEPREIVAYL
jgi:hypothetical protein